MVCDMLFVTGDIFMIDENRIKHILSVARLMKENAEKIGEMSHMHASKTHNRENNLQALFDIYEKIRG